MLLKALHGNNGRDKSQNTEVLDLTFYDDRICQFFYESIICALTTDNNVTSP